MKAYYIHGSDDLAYTLTLDEAKQVARRTALNSHLDIDVDRVEIATDRASILRMLNTNGAGAHVVIDASVYIAKAKPFGKDVA